MKIERDKFYKARNGERILIGSVNRPLMDYPVIGFREDGSIVGYTSEGRHMKAGQDPNDLISEWQEPLECWLSVDAKSGKMVGAYATESDAYGFAEGYGRQDLSRIAVHMREVGK